MVALTRMSQWCRPLGVQGRGSKTDAARSRSCGRADERGGEVSVEGEERGEADRILGEQHVIQLLLAAAGCLPCFHIPPYVHS